MSEIPHPIKPSKDEFTPKLLSAPDVRYGHSVESCLAAIRQGLDFDSSDE